MDTRVGPVQRFLHWRIVVKRGRSLWLVITAHAAYNMILFATTLLAGQEAVVPSLGGF